VAMAYFGMLPIGSLLVGAVSQLIGAPNSLLCQGALDLIIAATFAKFLVSGHLDKRSAERLREV